MPTFNQLVRKGRQTSEKKSTAPALQKGWNSLQKRATEDVYKRQVLLFRGQETMMPNGDTSLEGGDLLICAAPAFEDRENLTLYEVEIDKNHKWRDKPVNELDQKAGVLIVMVKREGSTLIPNGNTIIRQDDLLVFRRQKHAKQAHG